MHFQGILFMPISSVARFTALTQGYGGRHIIEDLNLSIYPGVTGLLGPNGAGKTTLFRTLATIAPPQSGELELFGKSVINERDVRKVRRRIGYLPQDFGYYPAFSITDFVRYCAWLREVPPKEAESATAEALAAVGLADRARDRMKSLSGGMLRRAGIAAAIVGSLPCSSSMSPQSALTLRSASTFVTSFVPSRAGELPSCSVHTWWKT